MTNRYILTQIIVKWILVVFYPFKNWHQFELNQDLSHLNSDELMMLAFQLAAQRLGHTNPNPAVGAMVVKEGKLIGWGATQAAGGNHAEVEALLMAGDNSQGADIYVTLEPCSHFGRTPPCCQAIHKAKLKRLYTSVEDENPRVAGKGIEYLKSNGVEVHKKIASSFGCEFYRPFFHWVKHDTPYVFVKTAHACDGGMFSTASDTQFKMPVAITSPKMNQLMSDVRRQAQYIWVGGETVRIDSPQLNLRKYQYGPLEDKYHPKLRVFTQDVTSINQNWTKSKGELLQLVDSSSGLIRSMRSELQKQGKAGVHQICIEAGPGLAKQLWQSHFFNQWIFIQSFQVKTRQKGPWGLSKWYPNPLIVGEICKFGRTEDDQFMILEQNKCLLG